MSRYPHLDRAIREGRVGAGTGLPSGDREVRFETEDYVMDAMRYGHMVHDRISELATKDDRDWFDWGDDEPLNWVERTSPFARMKRDPLIQRALFKIANPLKQPAFRVEGHDKLCLWGAKKGYRQYGDLHDRIAMLVGKPSFFTQVAQFTMDGMLHGGTFIKSYDIASAWEPNLGKDPCDPVVNDPRSQKQLDLECMGRKLDAIWR